MTILRPRCARIDRSLAPKIAYRGWHPPGHIVGEHGRLFRRPIEKLCKRILLAIFEQACIYVRTAPPSDLRASNADNVIGSEVLADREDSNCDIPYALMRAQDISFRSIKLGISRIVRFHNVSGQFSRSRAQSGTGSGRKWDRKWGPKGSAETWAWASESSIGSAPRKSRGSRHLAAIRTAGDSTSLLMRVAGGAGSSCMSAAGVAWNWDWVAAAICSLLPRAPRRRLCARCWRAEKTQRPPVPKRRFQHSARAPMLMSRLCSPLGVTLSMPPNGP